MRFLSFSSKSSNFTFPTFLEVVTVIVALKTVSKERKMKTKIIKKKRKKKEKYKNLIAFQLFYLH